MVSPYSKGLKRCGWLTSRGRCLALVPDRKHIYCPDHQQEYHDSYRKRVNKSRSKGGFYNRAAWKRLRKTHLAIEPFCVICNLPGNTIDHIIPHRGDPNLFFDSSNLQTTCKKCHDSVTALELSLRKQGKSDEQIRGVKLKMRLSPPKKPSSIF